MHANPSITDGVYGVLSGIDVKGEISELGKKSVSSGSDKIRELEALLNRLLLKLGENNIN